ncbi:hypothetical protein MKX03_010540 [Papaver bracteatum]|nr:hypothetical protein MKX03_010540 [Papaver bracteatum]
MESSTRYPLLTDSNVDVNDDQDDPSIRLKISNDQYEQPVQGRKRGWKSAIYIIGSRFYRSHVPEGSPLVGIMQVFVAAYRKRDLCVSKDGVPLYEEENRDDADLASKGRILAPTNQLKCLDKATIKDEMDTSSVLKK